MCVLKLSGGAEGGGGLGLKAASPAAKPVGMMGMVLPDVSRSPPPSDPQAPAVLRQGLKKSVNARRMTMDKSSEPT